MWTLLDPVSLADRYSFKMKIKENLLKWVFFIDTLYFGI